MITTDQKNNGNLGETRTFSVHNHSAEGLKNEINAGNESSLSAKNRAHKTVQRAPSAAANSARVHSSTGAERPRADAERRLGYTKDSLSAAGLVRSFAVKDFGVQKTIRIREAATDYFEDTLGDLGQIDFDAVQILFIGSGLNDYHAGNPIASVTDPYDEYTYCGAIRSVVKELREAYPDLRIIFVTPPYTWYTVPEVTCEEYDLGGGVLEDYVNAEIGICEALDVEVIDIYHDYYPHDNWDDLYLYTDDGLHPNEAGREKIAQTLADYLNQTLDEE